MINTLDTGLSWVPEFPLPSQDKWNLPCARNCVRNTLTRLFMHRQWWINDPDCIMLRDKLAFTQDEIIGESAVTGVHYSKPESRLTHLSRE